MGKYKKLIKNLVILTMGQFGSKILVFLLVPLYTSVLSTEEYGTYDLIYTTVNLLVPILTLNIAISTHRYLLDKDSDDHSIILITLKYTALANLCIFLIVIINHFFCFSKVLMDNEIVFILLFFALSVNSMMIETAIGKERIDIVTVSGFASTTIMIFLNYLLLIVFDKGITGYFVANTLGPCVQIVIIAIRLNPFHNVSTDTYSKEIEKGMLRYSCPQIMNSIGWWINNFLDRFIVTWLCGLTMNGIYSVGYKIPSILNVVQNIFGQAWGISAVKNFDEKDSDGFFSNTYEIYNAIMVVASSIIIAGTKFLARFMYAKDFYNAWIFVPFLTISTIFGALAGYLGGIFSARKEATLFAKSTILGALCNTVFNLILVSTIGTVGAAIATAISYFSIWLFRYIHAIRYIELKIRLQRDIFSYGLICTQAVLMMYLQVSSQIFYLIQGIYIFVFFMIYYSEFSQVLNRILKMVESKKRNNEKHKF